MFRLHKEGYLIVLVSLASASLLFFLFFLLLGDHPTIKWSLTTLTALLLYIVVQFFRNPVRTIENKTNKLVYAPADGKVVVIEQAQETEYMGEKLLQVSIFMSPLNVHVNRNPVSGQVDYFKYHPGKYLMAWDPKSSTENERTTIVYNTGNHKILMRQIAGFLARRIIAYPRTGSKVEQGDDMGFIRFGSRVDLYLPLNAQIQVKIDETVVGNKTVIAILPS